MILGLSCLAGCAKLHADSDLEESILYDGQTYLMPGTLRGSSYMWVSGSPEILVPESLLSDDGALFLCRLPEGALDASEVVMTGLGKEHPEYTLDLSLSCHPWTLVAVDESGSLLPVCNVGEVFFLRIYDICLGCQVNAMREGYGLDSAGKSMKLEAVGTDSQDSVPVEALPERSSAFALAYKAVAPGEVTLSAALRNASSSDLDFVRSLSISIQ